MSRQLTRTSGIWRRSASDDRKPLGDIYRGRWSFNLLGGAFISLSELAMTAAIVLPLFCLMERSGGWSVAVWLLWPCSDWASLRQLQQIAQRPVAGTQYIIVIAIIIPSNIQLYHATSAMRTWGFLSRQWIWAIWLEIQKLCGKLCQNLDMQILFTESSATQGFVLSLLLMVLCWISESEESVTYIFVNSRRAD